MLLEDNILLETLQVYSINSQVNLSKIAQIRSAFSCSDPLTVYPSLKILQEAQGTIDQQLKSLIASMKPAEEPILRKDGYFSYPYLRYIYLLLTCELEEYSFDTFVQMFSESLTKRQVKSALDGLRKLELVYTVYEGRRKVLYVATANFRRLMLSKGRTEGYEALIEEYTPPNILAKVLQFKERV